MDLVHAQPQGSMLRRKMCVLAAQQYWYNPDTKETTWIHPVTKQSSVRDVLKS